MEFLRSEYPRPDWQRDDWLNLNGKWQFTFDPEDAGLKEKWYATDSNSFNDEINVPFSWASPLSGVNKDVKGIGWYKRIVNWSPMQLNNRIFIRFGAVDYLCDLWINGTHVGEHTGGYSSFEFDVSDIWNSGADNLIIIKVQDYDMLYQTRGKQGYGEIRGIWQTVWLETRPKNYLKSATYTTNLSGIVNVNSNIIAECPGKATIKFNFDENNVKNSFAIMLSKGENNLQLSFNVPEPRLWDTEDPFLYEGYIELDCSPTMCGTDRVITYFGIREISSASFGERSYKWITLNSKPVFLNGTLDQSFNPEGYFTYPSDTEMHDEIWRLKRLGLNLVRVHIKPEEPRKLYWADKLGVLVMEDMPCFWGEPDEQARKAYQSEAEDTILRDINHPSIISWVMFNETWGLFSKNQEGKKVYKPETQDWVKSIYKWAKKLDATRLIEDNSACNYDHLESDLNTWHFYINGYPLVKDHILQAVDNTFECSSWNYVEGYLQSNAPLMNSECGNVWGIEGSAGDSDIAWHYHYMINEFRKHDKLCGFIFTEFHDVINEFNGYYRIDNSDKDFGYDGYCSGMSLKDIHTPDFLVIDAPPCTTIKIGEQVTVPVLISSYSNKNHGKNLTMEWELRYNNIGFEEIVSKGAITVYLSDYGVKPLTNINIKMPSFDSVPVLTVKLLDEYGSIITRNFITFDIRSGIPDGLYNLEGAWLSVPPNKYASGHWEYLWNALNGSKVNGAYHGCFEYKIDLSSLEALRDFNNMELVFEASSKVVLGKDKEMLTVKPHDISYMHGAKADPGMNINSYFMTDEKKHPTIVEVLIDNELIDILHISDDPADSKGVLSWHYQADHKKLDEAGSYGYLQKITIPSRIVAILNKKATFTLQFRVPGSMEDNQGGLAIYGRDAGRYPIDILVRYW